MLGKTVQQEPSDIDSVAVRRVQDIVDAGPLESSEAELDPDGSVPGVVESLVHTVVMSQSKGSLVHVHSTTTTTVRKLSLDSRNGREESRKLPTAKGVSDEPFQGIRNSVDSDQPLDHRRDKTPKRTSMSVLVQTDWSLVRVDGPQDWVRRKEVVDQGVQWETPQSSPKSTATLSSTPPKRFIPALESPSSQHAQHIRTSTPSSPRRPVPTPTSLLSERHLTIPASSSSRRPIAASTSLSPQNHIAISTLSSSQRPISASTSPPPEQHIAASTPSSSQRPVQTSELQPFYQHNGISHLISLKPMSEASLSLTISINTGPLDQTTESSSRDTIKRLAPSKQGPKSDTLPDTLPTQAELPTPNTSTVQHPFEPRQTSINPSPIQTETKCEQQTVCCTLTTNHKQEVATKIAVSHTSETELEKPQNSVGISSHFPIKLCAVSTEERDVRNLNEL